MEKKGSAKGFFFSDYLKPSQVIYDLKSKEKVAAIEELLDVLIKQKLISKKKLVLTRIIDRENLVSTAIGSGVALPHARFDTGGDIAVAVGRSGKGIEFDAHDGEKVHLIILVVWNPSIPGLFNHLFAGLARFLIKSENRHKIFHARNKNELFKILSRIEFRFISEDKVIGRAAVLRKLQEIEIKMKKTSKAQQQELAKQMTMMRDEMDQDLLARYDRLMSKYGFAVADAIEGVCQSCNINISTQMYSAIEGSNDIYVCENCGKFLAAKKKS